MTANRKKNILLIISGGIAAYKSLILIRRLSAFDVSLDAIVTQAAKEFITPLSVGTLLGKPAHEALFDLYREMDVGHIRLARYADLVLVAPATANILAQMVAGTAHDLATACLLATRAPVLVAPAMNPAMYAAQATQTNIATLKQRGIQFIGPETGEMAEQKEAGLGRMSEPETIAAKAHKLLNLPPAKNTIKNTIKNTNKHSQPDLTGKHVLITAGPTHEPIDPVRYIGNHASGKQGYALADAAAQLGATVSLISGPTQLEPPFGTTLIRVKTALQMLEATKTALPAHMAIFCAAVADWRAKNPAMKKMKKHKGQTNLTLEFERNPDIASTIGHLEHHRPDLVIGFAAETDNLIENASAKRVQKGLDIIVANHVGEGTQTMGGDINQAYVLDGEGERVFASMPKRLLAEHLLNLFAQRLEQKS